MKDFIPYEQALELKELGFDEPCFTYYFCNGILSDTPRESGDDIKYQGDCKFDNHQNSYLEEDDDCSAPLFQQAFGWFREKYGLYSVIDGLENRQYYKITQLNTCSKEYNTYEEAELACLSKLIEIVKNGTK
jgi:hypothetical protein